MRIGAWIFVFIFLIGLNVIIYTFNFYEVNDSKSPINTSSNLTWEDPRFSEQMGEAYWWILGVFCFIAFLIFMLFFLKRKSY